MRSRSSGWTARLLEERLGAARVVDLRAELEPLGIELIDVDEARELRSAAASLRRLAEIAAEPGPY